MNINNFSNTNSVFIDDGLRRYMRGVFTKMFMALCLTGGVSMICMSSPEILSFMSSISFFLSLITLGIVFFISFRINKMKSDTANALFWVYSSLVGASLSPLFIMYTGESLANTFFMTSIFFGLMSLYGYTTKKDLTSLGSFMIIGLWSIIIASIINIFLKSSALQMGLSAIAIIVFCGLTAWDVQKIKFFYNPSDPVEISTKKSILGALALYLDFINMFLHLLRFMGSRKD